MTKQIPLTRGKVALVNDDVFKDLNRHKWFTLDTGSNTLYAARFVRYSGKQTMIRMHREILGSVYGDNTEIDHINRNGLDNRRQNLRVVSHAVNMRNHGGHKHNTSGHNGVCWHKASKKWDARITVNGKLIHLGLYIDIKDAVEAREHGETEHWGKVCVY